MQIIEDLKNKLRNIEDLLKKEFSALRINRATPALVENILIDHYGVKTPLKQLASISAPEPRLLIIEPWDKNAINGIEKAIQSLNLGLSPISDKNLIRINIPPLTEERRDSLIKIVWSKLEEAKVKCRTARDETIKETTDLFAAKKITEDEKFKMKEKIQELIDETNKNLENLTRQKEKEIKE